MVINLILLFRNRSLKWKWHILPLLAVWVLINSHTAVQLAVSQIKSVFWASAMAYTSDILLQQVSHSTFI